ncbi:hypothetical protein OQA88_8627 [Cercophora sp. LCS_1]
MEATDLGSKRLSHRRPVGSPESATQEGAQLNGSASGDDWTRLSLGFDNNDHLHNGGYGNIRSGSSPEQQYLHVHSPVSQPSSPVGFNQDRPARPVSPLLDDDEAIAMHTTPRFHPGLTRDPSERSIPVTPPKQNTNPAQRKKRSFGDKLNGWWWWEVAAASLSTVCMVLLLILLLLTNDTPLEKWPLPIQPNSLIAVLTTGAKTTMMVPVAACLSQLKWRHYSRYTDKLQQLQVFDDASRGPWGSFIMILSLRKRAILAWSLAFVTIVALGIDPSAQQILDFPLRDSELTNLTVALGQSGNYLSKAFIEGPRTNTLEPTSGLLRWQAALLNGISGSILQPDISCPPPAVSCSWPELTTLGMCHSLQNVTAQVSTNCTGNTATGMTCEYDWPGREITDPIEMFHVTQNAGGTKSPTDLFRSAAGLSINKVTSESYLAFGAVRVTNTTLPRNMSIPPATDIFAGRLFWCTRTFTNITATLDGLTDPDDPGTVEELSFVDKFIRNFSAEDPREDILNGTFYSMYRQNSTGTSYNMSISLDEQMWFSLAKYLTREYVFSLRPTQTTEELDLGIFLYLDDLERMFGRLAMAMTNLMRNIGAGDNAEVLTVNGTATFKEAFIEVRWAWLVLPMVEIFLAVAILVAVIIVTRGEELVKESVIAYMVYPGDDRVRECLRAQEPRNLDQMSEAAKKVNVTLVRGPEGVRLLGG